ncbi:DEAD/DEAH box helicase [Clostridium sp. BJN0001]|uniref:DEAD/DEAH box helicase n=1 Tax=Clostridium sp. BJN0001 TaxID=2930219 RepID=UPI001FD4D4F0|nr:DEAD/DEAH box helicase [Clostridium sp. BJN0001]
MNLKIVIKNILKDKFSISYKKGKKHLLNENVKSVEVKETDGFTNIYGRVYDKSKSYFTQIRINEATQQIDFICNCELSEEAKRYSGNFICEHIIATLLKLTEGEDYTLNKNENIKVELRLEEKFNSPYKFDAILFLIGNERTKIASPMALKKYIENYKGDFLKKNENLLRILENTNFKIKDEDIRNILMECTYIDFAMKINSEYISKIKNENIPLNFTIKLEDERIKLQTFKTKIEALNTEKSVFLYNRCIYLPSIKQYKLYTPFYDVLHERHYCYIKKSSAQKVIKALRRIGKLKINDDVIDMVSEEYKFNLYFKKDNEKLYCEFNIPKEKASLKKSAKVKKIEEILFLNSFTKKDDLYYFVGEDESLIELIKSNISNLCDIKTSKDIGEIKVLDADDIIAKLEDEEDKLKFDLNISNIENDEWNSALDSFSEGKEFYRFNNYNFLDFNDENIRKFMNFLKIINYKGDKISLPLGYEDLVDEAIKNVDYIDVINKDDKKNRIFKTTIKDFKGSLRNYQKEGLKWLQNKKVKGLFGILADDMGLGKTIQIISFILKNRKEKTMIVTPSSLVYNWIAEFKKFAPTLKIACVHGSKDKRMKMIKSLSSYNVIITSYGTLNMDIDFYKDCIFDNLIIDEAQFIKNHKSKVTKSVKNIKSKVRFALTGTPIENNYLEIWSIFDFLKEGYLFSEKEFKTRFLNGDENQIKYLKIMIKPFILRRTKSQVLKELPDKIERTFYVEMTKEQKRYYKLSLKKIIKESEGMTNQISILSFLTKLRQIALDPSIIDDTYKGGSSKINKVLEIIDMCKKSNKKVLIFSQFTTVLKKLKEKLDKDNKSYFYLDGSTKASERVNLCERFNNTNDADIFLISLKAGGTGLNLTSAQVVIHFDPWWNPAVENQATDRAYRIGQKNDVEVIKIISKDTIEEKILKLKEEKSSMFNNLLDNDTDYCMSNTKLTKNEIKYLLSQDV